MSSMSDAIRAETVTIAGHGGDDIEAYLAQPLGAGAFGVVVVIHHFPGYDEETKEITRKFADHSYWRCARTCTHARPRAPRPTKLPRSYGRWAASPTSNWWATSTAQRAI